MEAFVNALLNTLMGMGTVFVVLIFISLIISLFVFIPSFERRWKRFFSKKKERKNQEGKEDAPAPQRPVIDEPKELVDDGALIAVLMAAIVASGKGAVSADRLVVRSVKKVGAKRR